MWSGCVIQASIRTFDGDADVSCGRPMRSLVAVWVRRVGGRGGRRVQGLTWHAVWECSAVVRYRRPVPIFSVEQACGKDIQKNVLTGRLKRT